MRANIPIFILDTFPHLRRLGLFPGALLGKFYFHHTVCFLLCLASFTQHYVHEIHPYCCVNGHSFSFLYRIYHNLSLLFLLGIEPRKVHRLLRQGTIHRIALTSDSCCKFWVPKTALRFGDSLEGLTEVIENCYIHHYSYCRERIQIKISQGKRHIRQSSGKYRVSNLFFFFF